MSQGQTGRPKPIWKYCCPALPPHNAQTDQQDPLFFLFRAGFDYESEHKVLFFAGFDYEYGGKMASHFCAQASCFLSFLYESPARNARAR